MKMKSSINQEETMKKTASEIKAEASALTKKIAQLDSEAKEIGKKLHDNRTQRRDTVAQRTKLFGELKEIRNQEAAARKANKASKAEERAKKAIEKAKAKKSAKVESQDFSDLTPQQLENELKSKKPAKSVAAKRAKSHGKK